jgi:hypothetical protein
MKRSIFSEGQVAYALPQAEGGTPVSDVCQQLGVSEAQPPSVRVSESPLSRVCAIGRSSAAMERSGIAVRCSALLGDTPWPTLWLQHTTKSWGVNYQTSLYLEAEQKHFVPNLKHGALETPLPSRTRSSFHESTS